MPRRRGHYTDAVRGGPSAARHTCQREAIVGVCMGAPWLGRDDTDTCLGVQGALEG